MDTAVHNTVTSACPLDCPDGCSLDVTVEDGRVVALTGNEVNPITQGFICGKVRHFPRHMYGDDRLQYPMMRSGSKGSGDFERVSWDAALDRVVSQLTAVRDEHGAEAILPLHYGGSNGVLTDGTVDQRFFRRLGASRLARTVCAAPTTAAARGLYGLMAGVAFDDYVHANLIVIWGGNPAASHIHLVPYIKAAQARGAKLVVIDPRSTQLAKSADMHLAIRPGTDLPIALSLIRELFETGQADEAFLAEHCLGVDTLRVRAADWPFQRAAGVAGISADDLRTLTEWYVAARPAVIRCGWGLERNRNGGAAAAAVIALPAVAGKFGVRGGGYTLSNSGAFDLDASKVARAPETKTREVNMNRTGRVLGGEEGAPVHALFVYNCNPLSTLPNQEAMRGGLLREDLFTVVFDQVITDTARYADVLLPATTFLEHSELRRSYGYMGTQVAGPVVEPVGEARPNYDVFGELLLRMGLDEPDDPVSGSQLIDAFYDTHPDSAEAWRTKGIAVPPAGDTPVQFVDVHPKTPNGKVHFIPPDLDAEAPGGLYNYRPDPGTEKHPLALISPALAETVSSTFAQLIKGAAHVEVHPTDAEARGINSEDSVRLFNDYGEVLCLARVTSEVPPGTVSLPKGLWARHTTNGNTANALAPDTLTDIGGGACFNDARVQLERHA